MLPRFEVKDDLLACFEIYYSYVVEELYHTTIIVTYNVVFTVTILFGKILKHYIAGYTVDVLHTATVAIVNIIVILRPSVIGRFKYIAVVEYLLANITLATFISVLSTGRIKNSLPHNITVICIFGNLISTVAICVSSDYVAACKILLYRAVIKCTFSNIVGVIISLKASVSV